MKTRFLRPFILLLAWTLLVNASGLACLYTGTRRTPTSTPRRLSPTMVTRRPTATRKPLATATPIPKTRPTATAIPQATAAPAKTTAPDVLRLVDVPLESVSPPLLDLPVGGKFQLIFHEENLTAQANGYLATARELPLAVQDLEVALSPGQVTVTALVPLAIFRVEASARGHWRAASCRFEAEIVEVRIGGQPAPAALREQVKKLLDDALKSLAESPICFTSVEIRQGELEINGYKK